MNSETSDRQTLLLNLTSKINLTLFILGFFGRSSARGGGRKGPLPYNFLGKCNRNEIWHTCLSCYSTTFYIKIF